MDPSVQKTMLIPLWNRASASKQYPEILVDQQAVAIVDRLDFDFASIAQTFRGFGAVNHLVRAKCMDEAACSYLSHHPRATIVNLGAGLDTNFCRVDNGTLRWIDLDLPDALAFRNRILPKKERNGQIARSILDEAWMDEVPFQQENGILLIAAGLFYFFREHELRPLFRRMAETFPGGELVFDANSSKALQISNEKMKKSGTGSANMHFSVDDPTLFEQWSSQIRVVSTHPRFHNIPRLSTLPEEIVRDMNLCDAENRILQIRLSFLPATRR